MTDGTFKTPQPLKLDGDECLVRHTFWSKTTAASKGKCPFRHFDGGQTTMKTLIQFSKTTTDMIEQVRCLSFFVQVSQTGWNTIPSSGVCSLQHTHTYLFLVSTRAQRVPGDVSSSANPLLHFFGHGSW
jgi:hypothetical protein